MPDIEQPVGDEQWPPVEQQRAEPTTTSALDPDTYRLCEAVAEMAVNWGVAPFVPADSRERTRLSIEWAREFEVKHAGTEWNEDGAPDYVITVDAWFETQYRDWLGGWHGDPVEAQDELIGRNLPPAVTADGMPVPLRERIDAWLAKARPEAPQGWSKIEGGSEGA